MDDLHLGDGCDDVMRNLISCFNEGYWEWYGFDVGDRQSFLMFLDVLEKLLDQVAAK